MYALLKPTALFANVGNPGNFPVYTNFATKAVIKMIGKQFERDKNCHLSFFIINQACFRMLDSNIADQFMVSNTPTMMGWNLSMSFHLIIKELEMLYGKPDTMLLFHKDVLFRSPFLGPEAPEMLFYRIKWCQEIQTIAQDSCTPKQIIGNAVHLLIQSGIFPLKEIDALEATPIKSYPILKTFIHEAYSRRLMAMQPRNMAGQQGYVNIILDVDGDEDINDNTTVTLPVVASAMATTGNTSCSTYTATTALTIAAKVTAAINQLSANQIAIM
jgi:hypothetical protein